MTQQQHLIVGASHAQWMALDRGDFKADWDQANRSTVRIDDAWSMLFVTSKSQFLTLHATADGPQVAWNPALLPQLQRYDDPRSQLVCLIGGNEHNGRYMLAHPQPFDLVHPRGPAPQAGRQIVPRRVIEQGFVDSLALTRTMLRGFAQLLPRAQRFMVAPPPPIAYEAQIRRHPEIFDFSSVGIEDAGVRLKVYETMVDVLAAIAGEFGFRLLMPPAGNRDERGFLAQPYWNYSTHATPAYYRPVWSQLAALAPAAGRAVEPAAGYATGHAAEHAAERAAEHESDCHAPV